MTDKKKGLLSVGLASLFVAFGVHAYRPWGALNQLATYRFDSVEGRVVKVHLDNDSSPIRVDYSYVIDGQRRFSDRLSYLVDDRKWELDSYAELQPGDPITVYVSDRDPDRSVLLQGFSRSAYFFGAWIGGVSLGWSFCVSQCFSFFRPKHAYRDQLLQRVEMVDNARRIRMVPDDMTPLSAGISCFLLVTAIVFALAITGDHWAGWWSISVPLAAMLAVLAGLFPGVHDYWYTKSGNERCRWDLIIDSRKGTIQLPAIGAYGEPTVVQIDAITRFTFEPLVKDEEETFLLFVLTLYTNEQGIEKTHKVSMARNRTKLAVLAEWIQETAGLPDDVSVALLA